MKQHHHPSERGQALLIIAFAVLGLIALTALSIDGGNVYSDRRNAQNAADTAVLASALTYIRSEDWSAAETDGKLRAEDNGYPDNGIKSTVEFHHPPQTGPYSDCTSTDFDCNEYMQIVITSIVDTYFAPIVGITELTNQVNAVARVEPTFITPFLEGNAIVSCNKHACPAVDIGGGSTTTLIDGGVFVNSDCTDNSNKYALEISNNAGLVSPSLCSVGGYTYGSADFDVDVVSNSCEPVDCDTAFIEPNFDNFCQDSVSVDPNDPTRLLPGEFSSNSKSFPPSGIEKLAPGVYCINSSKGFRMNSGSLYGREVVFYMPQGGIDINTDDVYLYAPTTGDFLGLLFQLPRENDSAITINGNANNEFSGTIMAPSSKVNINGGSATYGFMNTQIIADTAAISGGANSTIVYNGDKGYEPQVPPQIELTE